RLEDAGLADGLGEVLVAGPGVLYAYYEPWRPRAGGMPGGRVRTRDRGGLGTDGCLWLRGRAKDGISAPGMKVFPPEVEAALSAHPAVAAACVCARPDARLGEVPHARVVLRAGAVVSDTELQAYCAARLAGFKVPQRVEFVAALERTASGKLVRRDSLF